MYRTVWRTLPRALRRRLYPHGVLRIPIDADHAFSMICTGEYIEADVYRWGFGNGWEGVSLRAWARLAAGSATIVDIGAYRGIYALSAKAMNPRANVIAFEPGDMAYQRVSDNARLNGFEITAERLALSDRTGEAVLYATSGGGSSSIEGRPDQAYVEVPVATTTLDGYFERSGLDSADLVKIDVEGHEAAVLRGMRGILARSRPTLLMEVLTDAVGAAELELIKAYGYEMFRVHDNDGLEPISTLGGQIRGSRNVLLCQPEAFETAQLKELLVG